MSRKIKMMIVATLFLFSSATYGQDVRFGIFADPVFSWFGSNSSQSANDGVSTGISYGFNFHRYFANNYAFSTGINLINSGGKLTHDVPTEVFFNNITAMVEAGEQINYRINYLAVPIGIYMKTNQIGYLTIFSDIGIDPKVVIGAKADIPSADIKKETAVEEIGLFNLSYHIMGGVEYSLGGSTALIFGVGFDNNFIDITTDKEGQPVDKIKHRILKIKMGINF